MRLLLNYWRLSILAQVSYKRDFFIELIVWFFYSLIPFCALSLLLEKFLKIGNLSIYEIAILYGLSQISYDLARMIGRGFDNFSDLVMSGDFDLFYIRPLGIVYQVMANDLFLRRIAGILQGILLTVYGLISLQLFTIPTILILMVLVISAAIMFLSLYILNASLTLITLKENVFIGYLFDMASQTGYYPIDLLKNPIKAFLTYIIPIGLCIYYPTIHYLNNGEIIYNMARSIIISLSLLGLSMCIFSLCRKKYKSINN